MSIAPQQQSFLDRIREATGLSRVFADVFVERACERAGCRPEALTPEHLARLMPDFERALSLFLRDERLEQAIQRLRALTS